MPKDSYSSSRRRGAFRRSLGDADEGPRRVIRSDVVRYPGMPEGGFEQGDPSADRDRRARLRPARDAGISVASRAARDRKRAQVARRNIALAVGLAVTGVFVTGFMWRWVSDMQVAARPMPTRSSAFQGAVVRAASPQAQPTPVFASYRSLRLRLPVATTDLTELGFHQASYAYALRMKSRLPDADMDAANKKRGTEHDGVKVEKGLLPRQVLRMWRDRPGKPDTAADVGALAGAGVLAPLDGTVVLVKRYSLYGKYPDVQIHIRPDAAPTVDCVIIHIEDPTVKAGDRVMAGITPIGRVRKLSDRIHHQLGDYTSDPGDHVHLQLNDSTDPSYEGLKGAIASGS